MNEYLMRLMRLAGGEEEGGGGAVSGVPRERERMRREGEMRSREGGRESETEPGREGAGSSGGLA